MCCFKSFSNEEKNNKQIDYLAIQIILSKMRKWIYVLFLFIVLQGIPIFVHCIAGNSLKPHEIFVLGIGHALQHRMQICTVKL